jgi:hypothetical protein
MKFVEPGRFTSGLPPVATVGADIPVRQLRANNCHSRTAPCQMHSLGRWEFCPLSAHVFQNSTGLAQHLRVVSRHGIIGRLAERCAVRISQVG